MSLGAPTELALENMVKRVDSSDLELVVTAVLIQRQVGGIYLRFWNRLPRLSGNGSGSRARSAP